MKTFLVLVFLTFSFLAFSQSIDSSYHVRKNLLGKGKVAYLDITRKTPVDTVTRNHRTVLVYNTEVEMIGLFSGDTLLLNELRSIDIRNLSRGDTITISAFMPADPPRTTTLFVNAKLLQELEIDDWGIWPFAIPVIALLVLASIGTIAHFRKQKSKPVIAGAGKM